MSRKVQELVRENQDLREGLSNVKQYIERLLRKNGHKFTPEIE